LVARFGVALTDVQIPEHPRSSFEWVGPLDHESAFVDALERGRLHHAWLITGPEGAGKATFAYRAARRLLGASPRRDGAPLESNPHDPVVRQIMARAHPDLLVLQRDPEDGKARRNIPVDEARNLSEFFSKSPAAAPYRVAIVDAADDLNQSAANALLKTMEEPPARGVIFLISQSPGGLLGTIRSRCRRLAITAPDLSISAPWVAGRAGVERSAALQLLEIARGAPGAAWRLGASGALEALATAKRLISALPDGDERAELALAESFRGAQGAVRFQLIFDCLAAGVQTQCVAQAENGPISMNLDKWSRAWSEMMALHDRVEAVNLDRGEAFLVTLSRLRALG
jgi:DNA polymerase-3 subunit delta'